MSAAGRFQLSPNLSTLFVLGGSQGSATLNRHLEPLLPHLAAAGIQVLWQTGPKHWDRYHSREAETVRVLPFIDRIEAAYALADLVLSRAGALALAELTVCGKPSLLIPFPGATGDHQTYNAQVLARAGAAQILPEGELDSTTLQKTLSDLFQDPDRLKTMGRKAASLGQPEATRRIVAEVFKLLSGDVPES